MALNPEAPEFVPALNTSFQNGFATLHTAITLSNNLPGYVQYKQYTSITDFKLVTQRFNHNVIYQLNRIFEAELQTLRLKEDEYEYNMERIIDGNDRILDRMNRNMDFVDKGVQPNQQNSEVMAPGAYGRPIITTIQITTGMNIPRPQLQFKDTIDNSSALWMPKITEKPNTIKPLALQVLYDSEGNPVGFEHPYETELRVFTPQFHWLEPDHEPLIVPQPVEYTQMIYVCNENQVDELISHLQTVEVLGVDLEHHSYRSYQGITCLLQISTDETDFIVDALAVREHLHKLNEIFTNPMKIKVFHGADKDIQWLQRDFGVYVVGLFDTFQAACVLNLEGRSLAALLMRYCNLVVDKSFQQADWRLRPLTFEMIKYARTDTHYLPYIWRCMRANLLMADNGNPQLLLRVFELSRRVSGITYNKPVVDENSHKVLHQRTKKAFNAQQMAALRLLYQWRDETARATDESRMYILPNDQMLQLAEKLPRETQGVVAVCVPMPPHVRQNLDVVHRMLLSCRQLSVESPFHMSGIAAACMEAPALEYNVHEVLNEPQDSSVGIQQEHNTTESMEVEDPYQNQSVASHPQVQTLNTSQHINSSKIFRLSGGIRPFLSPYDRHTKYRILALHEEVSKLKEKQDKIAAISKGNELIQTELLNKLQTVKEQVIKEQAMSHNTSDVAQPSTSRQADETVCNETRTNCTYMAPSKPNFGLNTNAQSGNAAGTHGQTASQTGNNTRQPRPCRQNEHINN